MLKPRTSHRVPALLRAAQRHGILYSIADPIPRLVMGLFARFLGANRRLSARFDHRKDLALYWRYDADVQDALSRIPANGLVADLGGGRTCSFASSLPPERSFTVVAVDSSEEELRANTAVDLTRVADVSRRIPFADGEVDLLVSRTLLEHVSDVGSTVHEVARVLVPGGRTIHLLPCRYAIFAIFARVVPFTLAKRVLHTMIPESRAIVEFDVVYDRGHPKALEHAFREAGFRDVNVICTYDQSAYFHAFFPAFLLVYLYQRLAEALRLRILASYAVVHAIR